MKQAKDLERNGYISFTLKENKAESTIVFETLPLSDNDSELDYNNPSNMSKKKTENEEDNERAKTTKKTKTTEEDEDDKDDRRRQKKTKKNMK